MRGPASRARAGAIDQATVGCFSRASFGPPGRTCAARGLLKKEHRPHASRAATPPRQAGYQPLTSGMAGPFAGLPSWPVFGDLLLDWAPMPPGHGSDPPSSGVTSVPFRLVGFVRRHARVVAPMAAAAVLVVILLVNALLPAEVPATPYGRVVNTACRVDQVSLIRMARAYRPGRAGDIEMVPREPNLVARPDGGLTHEGPFTNLQHIPLFLLGQGYIKRERTVLRGVRAAAIAPTIASLLDFESRSWLPEEAPLAQAVRVDQPEQPPKLILTLVWEGIGRNVLAKWPDSWPDLARLRNNGTWYEKASAGTSPSAAAPVQATMGTAVYPRTHGIVGEAYRIGGRIVPAYSGGPSDLLVPTLADIYDRAEHGRPLVGLIGSDTAGFGLLGHGGSFPGGDGDILALHPRSGRGDRWRVPSGSWGRNFELPGALAHLRGLKGRFDTPAGADYETAALEQMISREGFGRDDVSDVLFASYSMGDSVAERYGMGSPQMRDAVAALDHQLFRLRSFLNESVGMHQWVMIVTADHGSTPNPAVVGSFVIDPTSLQSDLERQFGGGKDHPSVVTALGATQIWLNMPLLQKRGFTTNDVSRFLLDYTAGDNRGPNVEGADAPVFQAAFPTTLLPHLPCLGS
jgi:hypothetical protein